MLKLNQKKLTLSGESCGQLNHHFAFLTIAHAYRNSMKAFENWVLTPSNQNAPNCKALDSVPRDTSLKV